MPDHTTRVGLLALLMATGCSHGDATSATESRAARAERTASAPAAQSAAPAARKHMLALYWLALKARDAVMAGDLASAKQAAEALRDHEYAAVVRDDSRHWRMRMQQRADEVVLAADLEATARSIAALGQVCGDCHVHEQARLIAPGAIALEGQDPPDRLDARMHRHDIGADQLWIGLIYPSESAWQRGTMTLTRAPLSPPVREGEQVEPALAARIEEIRALAKQARAARSGVARAAVYGELLSRCSSCHFTLRGVDPGG